MTLTVGPVGARVRWRFEVRGVVQGVGFRPFVYALATAENLSGTVHNDSDGVLIEVEGALGDVQRFARRLRADAPPLAVIDRVGTVGVGLRGGSGFSIGPSQCVQGGQTLTSPDIATCDDCLREMADPADRRYRHPFITCTNCGPRFTIITGLPYDRPSTTMASFAMCARCAEEYGDPGDRRFHAQPIACPDCGPTLELVVDGGTRNGQDALTTSRRLLAAGAVLAVKGIGGYHLACDSSNEQAVATLRRRKARGNKPFAVMVGDVETARELTHASADEVALLTSPRRPIVLLRRRAGAPVAASVAPGNPDLGVMLAYTPLHALLFGIKADEPGPQVLVMTSGNVSGEPIAYDDADALIRLAGLADGWLRHDRRIQVPVDDSVSRMVDGAELPLRRSRGYAPLPLALPFPVPPMLAVGADLKNACCVGAGRYAWLSQHIGDMDDVRTGDAFSATAEHLQQITGVRPSALAADGHPGYRSTGWARRNRAGRHLHIVQHHHGHIASVMAEHGHDGGAPVIGFAFDGTGYGTDGAIWGGELLIADYLGFERFAHLAYVPLPGGDAAIERPYRMALAHLFAAGVAWTGDLPCVAACPPDELRVLAHQLETGLGCVATSSMGRLFDAVSALVGIRQVADYEAQAAIELEGISRDVGPDDVGPGDVTPAAYRFDVHADAASDAGVLIDAAAVIRSVAADVVAGVSPAVIGARFHAGVIAMLLELAERVRDERGLNSVALSGGVFQNATLLGGACSVLRRSGFEVLRHRIVPPNDGGIALGQLAVAAAWARSCALSDSTKGARPCA